MEDDSMPDGVDQFDAFPTADGTNRDPDSRESPSLLDGSGVSRRQYLSASAAVGAAALGVSGSASAANDPTDVDILNFALTLEYLEARFYEEGLDTIGRGGLNRGLRGSVGGKARGEVFSELRTVQAHEEEHVAVLVATIESLGGTPVEEPEFDFGTATSDPAEFLGTAALLETTGVAAYAGAAPLIDDPTLIPPALGIHSVEARHTSYLNVLNGETGFPNVIDEPQTMDEVLAKAGQFIV